MTLRQMMRLGGALMAFASLTWTLVAVSLQLRGAQRKLRIFSNRLFIKSCRDLCRVSLGGVGGGG